MDEFLLRALVGGLLIAMIAAPLGCMVVWQRMAWFGAALSHAALLGVALGFLLEIDTRLAILLISILMSLLLLLMQRFRDLGNDTLLGILAHGSLAFGLIAISLLPTLRIDLMAYLFGDILTVTWMDIAWILAGSLFVIVTLLRTWNPLLSVVVQSDLAAVDGHHPERLRFLFLLMLSVAVAVSMQVVGLLLVVSLLIIPAATARGFARSPEQMVLISLCVAALSVVLGLALSFTVDTPTGPSIVASVTLLFALTLLHRNR
jgi:zinc transport system permease protein